MSLPILAGWSSNTWVSGCTLLRKHLFLPSSTYTLVLLRSLHLASHWFLRCTFLSTTLLTSDVHVGNTSLSWSFVCRSNMMFPTSLFLLSILLGISLGPFFLGSIPAKTENWSQGGLPVVRYGSSSSRIFSRHFTCVLSVKSQPVSRSTAYPGSNPNALHFSANLGGENISVTSCAPNAFSSVFVGSSTCDSTPMWNNDWMSCSGSCLRISGCGTTGDQIWLNWSRLRVEPGAADPNAAPSAEAAGGSDWMSAEPPVEITTRALHFLRLHGPNRPLIHLPSFHLCWVSLLLSFQALLFPLLLGFSWGWWPFLPRVVSRLPTISPLVPSDLAILILRLSPSSSFLLPVFSQHRPISFDLLRCLSTFPSARFYRSCCG